MELSQYEICYLPRVAIKGQAMEDFIAEQTPNKENKVQPNLSSSIAKLPKALCPTMSWDLYVDDSLNDNGYEASLILSSLKLERLRIEYNLWLGFKASNNEAEYKAQLTGLRLAQIMGSKGLCIFNDS